MSFTFGLGTPYPRNAFPGFVRSSTISLGRMRSMRGSSSGRVVRISDLASRDPALLEEFSSPAIVDPLESLLGPDIDFIRNRHNHATVAVEPTCRSWPPGRWRHLLDRLVVPCGRSGLGPQPAA
jgi:hypothetical protein